MVQAAHGKVDRFCKIQTKTRMRLPRHLLIGKQFSRWTVIAAHPEPRRVVCQCACGAIRTLFVGSLQSGDTKSCNCYRIDSYKWKGKSRMREYFIWKGIIRRCTDPKCKEFQWYGAKGITVCKRWLESFDNFLSDLGPRPSPAHSIDRINTYGNYEPENCRWATMKQQVENRRNIHWITFNGETMPLKWWAKRFHLTYSMVLKRLSNKWPLPRLLSPPIAKFRHKSKP
jgi:hypothetical protein